MLVPTHIRTLECMMWYVGWYYDEGGLSIGLDRLSRLVIYGDKTGHFAILMKNMTSGTCLSTCCISTLYEILHENPTVQKSPWGCRRLPVPCRNCDRERWKEPFTCLLSQVSSMCVLYWCLCDYLYENAVCTTCSSSPCKLGDIVYVYSAFLSISEPLFLWWHLWVSYGCHDMENVLFCSTTAG